MSEVPSDVTPPTEEFAGKFDFHSRFEKYMSSVIPKAIFAKVIILHDMR